MEKVSLWFNKKEKFSGIIQSNWFFPVVLAFILFGLASFHISGSSIGIYDGVLNNKAQDSTSFINYRPLAVRSDEWLVMTQMTVLQYENDFPVVNTSIGKGQDMAIVLDVPYKDWSVLFKPQNLIFFVAPLDFAFSFKWWLLGALLILGAYTFSLSILRKKNGLAALIGIGVFLSPMVQWWYQSTTIIPLAMGFFIAAILVQLNLRTNSTKKSTLLHLAFIYCSVVFAMAMYPPFQIPILLVIVSLYISLFFSKLIAAKTKAQKRKLFKQLGFMVLSGTATIAIIGTFIIQHKSAIETITHTTYPGARVILPGDYSLLHLFSGYLAAFHQSTSTSSHYKEIGASGSNQSELSNFLVPTLTLMVIGLVFIAINWKQKDIKIVRNLIIGVLVILSIFLLHMFIPAGEAIYKLIGLNFVPHTRLLLGMGFGAFILLVLLISYLSKARFRLSGKQLAISSCFIAVFYFGLTFAIAARNPGFIGNMAVAIVLTSLMIGFLVLLLAQKFKLALVLLVILSAWSVQRINPLDRHLDELTSTQFSQFIQNATEADPKAKWASNDLSLENYPLTNGAKTLSGTYLYPQHSIWKNLDKENKYYSTYNRYAHVIFKFDDLQKKPKFTLLSMDSFQVTLSACDPFLTKYNVKYIYGRTPVNSKCVKPITTYQYGLNTIYIYKRSPALE